MTKEEILELLTNQDEQKAAMQLSKAYLSNPNLIEEIFVLERTIIHLLVLRNKVKILECLLSQELFKKTVLATDRKGDTCFHYVVKEDDSYQEAFNTLVKYCPDDLLNKTNNQGNTPLHQAVIANRQWAIQALIKIGKVNRSVANSQGKTVFDLAKNHGELMSLLTEVRFLNLRSRINPGSENLDFKASFPLLSKPSHSPGISYSADFVNPFARLPGGSEDKDLWDFTEGSQEPILISQNEFVSRYQELVVAFKVNRNSADCFNALSKFCFLCQHYSLESSIKELRRIFNVSEDDLLKRILCQLERQIDAHYSLIQEENSKLLQAFVNWLTRNHIFAVEELTVFPSLEEINAEEIELLEFLWHLTLGQEEYEIPCRAFSFKKSAERTLGALSSFPINKMLLGLRRLYPYFDTQQKLAANYIVWELFSYHIIDRVFPQDQVILQVRFFIKKNLQLGALGSEINEQFRMLLELNTESPSSILFRNFSLLKEQLRTQEPSKEKVSFSHLVTMALAKSRQDRAKEVRMIAHELKMLTVTFYQKVSLSEFGKGNWSKPDKEKCSANIIGSIRSFNYLSEFFIEKILVQPKANLKNTLQFIIELVKEIGSFEEELYPDLDQLMILSSVFNAAEISRLEVFNNLPEEDLHLKAELDRLLSREKNSKWMREVYRLYRTALPYLGNILTDLTFAYDGNLFPLLRAEAMGGVLLSIIKTKSLLNYKLAIYQTDLQSFLLNYQEVDRELFYYQSMKLQPRKNDVFNLDEAKDFQILLDDLQNQYLSEKILPHTKFNKMLHLPHKLAINLLTAFENQMKLLILEFSHLSGY